MFFVRRISNRSCRGSHLDRPDWHFRWDSVKSVTSIDIVGVVAMERVRVGVQSRLDEVPVLSPGAFPIVLRQGDLAWWGCRK
jgi:hypothetical protein